MCISVLLNFQTGVRAKFQLISPTKKQVCRLFALISPGNYATLFYVDLRDKKLTGRKTVANTVYCLTAWNFTNPSARSGKIRIIVS
jgi:hypothetical protein